jgi:hypothetical protein
MYNAPRQPMLSACCRRYERLRKKARNPSEPGARHTSSSRTRSTAGHLNTGASECSGDGRGGTLVDVLLAGLVRDSIKKALT